MKKSEQDKKSEFLKRYNLTEEEFIGKLKIGYLDLSSLTSIPEGFNPTVGGSLDLRSLTSIPEGFNPTVGGSLDLRSLTSIPEGFNPTVGGDLNLSSLTSIPEGFNPTVGGYLDLSSLTSIPEGFNPTVGGSLDLRSGRKYIGANVPDVEINKNFIWSKNGKRYAKIDGMFCEVLTEREYTINGLSYKLYSAKKVNRDEHFFIVNKDKYYAHAEDLKKAISDLQFKMMAETLKKEPIKPDTVITRQYYRLITGACEFGVDMWVRANGLSDLEEIKASDLLKLLEKTNAYGLQEFKKLVQF